MSRSLLNRKQRRTRREMAEEEETEISGEEEAISLVAETNEEKSARLALENEAAASAELAKKEAALQKTPVPQALVPYAPPQAWAVSRCRSAARHRPWLMAAYVGAVPRTQPGCFRPGGADRALRPAEPPRRAGASPGLCGRPQRSPRALSSHSVGLRTRRSSEFRRDYLIKGAELATFSSSLRTT